ncbi:hypothetical protein Pcinc_027738 [Petrolisthes cinctipes]|uniref:Pericentrin/AKAP-450 centrosomal targeting domain-containing protein n=1 Tax=Petrolisthes cinctipes TaxID=88211 RepID=A0AAE1K882_PETCI|nr:hypothetical protein Pcinc_027738 [Petrolisthes cinctipes]
MAERKEGGRGKNQSVFEGGIAEFEEELECAVRQRLASLRQEVENEIKFYMKPGATTTKENEDSGVTSPGHHNTGASQDTLSLEQDSGSSASYQYSQVKEQKSTVVFPLTQDISTEDGQGSRILSTSQEDTSTGHQKDSTMPSSTQGIDTKEREDSIVTLTPLDTPRTREAAGISILIQEENSVAPSSPPQDTTGFGVGESSRKSPVATQDRNGLTRAQKKFVKEFLAHCNKIYQEAETEKLEMLRNQKTVVHKILEDNKAKLHTVCLEYISRLNTLSALPDAVSCGQELACTLEESLSGEAVWVTEKYTELLQQYTKEQAARARSHSHITNSFTDRLTALFTHTGQESSKYEGSEKEEDKEDPQLEEDQKGEVIRLEGEVRCLEAQLEARDSQDLRHLQGLYNDRDWYKRMVAVLSHVTLQLLHFYTVAQTLAQPAQDPRTPTVITPQPDQPVSRPLDLHSPTDIPSRLDIQVNRPLDMSFLSEDGGEGWVEGGHYTSFTDDEAATTGLVGAAGQDQDAHEQRGAEVAAAGSGRTGSGEGGSTCESGLDSTGLSEGLLEDLDKDQQLRPLLTRSCPHLLAVLGGRWEKVNLSALEKEAQELAISLQAAAGMLNIFIHSTHSGSALDPSIESVNLSSTTLKEEKSVEGEEEAKRMEEEACLKQRGEALNVNSNNKTDNLSAMTSKDDTNRVDLTQYDLSYLDLGDLSKTLMELVTEEHRKQDIIARENIDDYTQLHYKNSPIQDQLLEALSQLGSKEDLQLRLHHLLGRVRGLEEQQVVLEEENKKLAHTNKTLASKLQVTQDQLEEIESGGGRGSGEVTLHYAAKMEANKDLRERVRLLLSAKKKSNLCREELVERVSELEGVVGSVVSEADATIAIYKSQVTDLTQQLEAADRQVRSSRQFLEQQASERDQEMEELLATTSRISSQLKDKEAQLASHSTLQTEVESLERQLRDKNQELEEVRADRELTQTENKAAQDKIRDLREIIQTLEGQVDKRGMAEAELRERVVSLETALTHANSLAHSLSSQLEDLQYKRNEEQMYPTVRNSAGQGGVSEEEEEEERGGQEGTAGQLTSTSLFTELQEETDFTLLEMIEERLEKTIGGLEAVQLSSPLTPTSTAREAGEDSLTPDNTSDDESVGDLRCLSPPSLLRRMEGSLARLGQVAEAAVKKVKQTETMHTDLKLEYDEAVSERDMAETRWREQVMAVAVLEAKVEELRHSQPITSTAQLNIRLTRVQEELENNQALLTKKAREVEEVKHALASTREQLLARDKELERLQTQLSQHDSTGQPHSLPHTSTDQLLTKQRQLENDLAAKNALIDKLKSEVREGMLGQVLPPSLAASLIAEKNAELAEQGHMLNDLQTKMASVMQFLASGCNKEATQMLEEMRTGGSHSDRVDKGRKAEMTPEILRNIPPPSDVFLHTTYQREVGNVKEASIELSAVTLVSSEMGESDRGSSTTQPSSSDLQLMSPQPELHTQNSKGNLACSAEEEGDMSVSQEEWQCECGARGQVAILRGHLKVLLQEVASLTDYQAKLEEDYQTAQGLLEAKEAELEEMTGEIEDRVEPPPPLLSLSSPVLCSCQALKKQNGELQDQLSELESSHQRREEETKEILWRMGEEKEQLMWEKQRLLREKQNLVEESNKLLEEKQALTLETETLKLTLRQFEEELEILKKNLRKLQEEEERLSTKVRERDQKVEEQREKEEGLRKELQQRERQLRKREVELHELKTKERKRSKEAVGAGGPCEVGDEQRLSSHSEQEVMRLHQHYQQEITGLKEQLIVREKELCSDYEERLAAQVSEMSRRLMDEHQAAKTRQQRVYEAALHAAQQDREHAMEQVWQLTQGNNQSQPLATDTSKLIASVDALTTRVREEVEHSGRLDDSLALLASQDKGQEGEMSTRASSIASDRSEVTDMAEVTSQLQHLIKKVHQQGIEMLTRVELLFLQKHSGQLDTTQRSLISHLSSDTTVLESETVAGEGTQMSRLEEELSKREQEEKKKSMCETMERRMEQEQLAGRAWRLAYERERKEAMEQHEKDQLAIADLDVEIKELRADIFLNKLELQRAQDRITTLNESVEERVRQVNSLQAALDEEHNNFTRVSKVLNQERKLATLGRSQQESVIKDLREKLEKECEKVLSLHKRLIEVNSEQETTKPAARQTPSLQELQIQLAAEQKEKKKLEEAYDRERMRAAVALEKVHAECARTRVELSKEKGQVTVLTKAVRTIKTEREVLLKQMSEKCKQVQQLERKLREAKGETQTQVCGVQQDQGESQHQEANRLSQGIHQLHLCTHNKPNEDDYCGVQLNLEVCKSVLELTDKLEEAQAERASLQAKISSLESTVVNLSSQLQKAATTKIEQHQEGTQGQDVAAWAADRESLLRMVTLKDSEVARLKAELRLMSQPPGSVMVDDEKLQYLYSQYLQCEHRMKALVWQKRYLLVVLRGYDNTERQTIARLHHMAAQVLPSSRSHRNTQPTSPLHTTFRVAVLGVMAVCRMRALVERFSRKKGLGVQMLLARPNTLNLTDRSWAGSSNSVLSAGAVGGIRVVGGTRTVLSESRSGSSESLVGRTGTGHGGVETMVSVPEFMTSNQNEDVGAAGRVVAGLATEISFTGRTPPTRGPTRSPAQASPKHSRRTLFSEGSSPSANVYIERLDSIHQTLGLHPKKP